jgi:hypothetical protein
MNLLRPQNSELEIHHPLKLKGLLVKSGFCPQIAMTSSPEIDSALVSDQVACLFVCNQVASLFATN